MQKIMKSSMIRQIVVRLSKDNVSEYDIDGSIFDDPFLEAATRAVEKTKKRRHGIINAVVECWDKNTPKKSIIYNSYWILVNAACYSKAELLREKFKMQHNGDLAKEPIRGSDIN